MITYLLLRNNKESGPFNFDELLQFKMKPYDLIWVNGKSAAWRYPSEIEELKPYAPVVEEQPYDRFFKKPSNNKPEESPYQPIPEPVPAIQTQPQAIPQPKPQPYTQPIPQPQAYSQPEPQAYSQPKPEPQPNSFTPKKSVYVTLPGQKAAVTQPIQQPQPERKPEPIPVAETISITENPVAAEIKYSQPLDEIKEMYVKTLQQRKQRIANRAFIVQALKKAAVILAIVGAGVLIGLTLNSRSSKKDAIAENKPAVTQPQPQTQPSTSTEDAKVPVQDLSQLRVQDEVAQSLATEKQESEPLFVEPSPQKPRNIPVEKSTSAPARKQVITEPDPAITSPGVEMNVSTGERSRKVRNGVETFEEAAPEELKTAEPKATLKNNELSKLVSVSSNDYQRVAFGGIRNLQLTVYNDSRYALNNVTVELQYLKPSEQPLRTENIQFRSIAPGGSLTIRVPDTNRGIKVLYRITNILSTQSAKESAGL